MRTIILGLLILVCASIISAQPKAAKIILKSTKTGKVTLSKGTLRSTIDLSRNVAGCAYVSGEVRRELDKKGCAASPAEFKLLDAQTKNKQNFLLIEAAAMGNCNVCGQCGASESSTLIWLKLDARLKVLDKKEVPIEDCRSGVSFVATANKGEADESENSDLKFKNDILHVEFEKRNYDNSDNIFYEYSILDYSRKTPEKGFIIKAEKRENSVN